MTRSCALLLAFCALCAHAVAACELKMRVSQFPPLTFQKEDKTWSGLDVELTAALVTQMGCRLRFVDIPWKRSLLSLAQGDVDVMANLSKTGQRAVSLHFVGPERNETIVLALPHSSDLSLSSLDDFKKLNGHIGIQTGSFYGQSFEYKMQTDPLFAAKFEAVPNDLDNIRKLERQRILGFFGDYYQIGDLIRRQASTLVLKAHPFVINSDAVYFGFSKKSVSPILLERADNAMQSSELKTQFEQIIARYSIAP